MSCFTVVVCVFVVFFCVLMVCFFFCFWVVGGVGVLFWFCGVLCVVWGCVGGGGGGGGVGVVGLFFFLFVVGVGGSLTCNNIVHSLSESSCHTQRCSRA